MNPQRKTYLAAFLTGALALACGSNAVVSSVRQPVSGNGQLAVSLVDAPNPVVDEIWVNVTSVRAHSTTAGWVTVASFATPKAIDLLKLQAATLDLGLVDLPPGTITQIRLLVAEDGNHVVKAGQSIPLKVPSGCQSGIKIHGPWEIAACERASVTLDFDGKKSIWTHPTGQGDEWILRPVIHTRKSSADAVGCGTPDAGTGETTPPSPTPTPTPPGGAGAPCGAAIECLSGVCGGVSCLPGPAGSPCSVAADCASGACGADGTCAAGTAGPAGSPCTANTQCLSNACNATTGVCDPGVQGTPCTTTSDCPESLVCSSGSCEAIVAQ
jgi:hypothetical protein